ncbi:MAG: UvrB/UvrC motif-containing protein [Coriobacteriia bacterium]|nr:UvrB/UvrC motif-containing protein [Coriobacteriia bacterium]
MLGPTALATGAFVTVDIETTGCRPGTSSVIEIGAVRVEHGTITDSFTCLVSPNDTIPAPITHLTGITEEMVAGAPAIGESIAQFREFLRDAVLVAHNHRFDMSFLDYEAERQWGTPFARPILDTLTLARRLHPELPRHNLRDLALFYGAETVPTHRALPDALATAEVLIRMLPELESAGMTTAAQVARLCGIAEQSHLARKLPLATHVPDGPGIYLFRDAIGSVVFVGRAKSLRTQIRNHFYASDDPECPSAASEVVSISHYPLVSALDATLLEFRLMDRYVPAFNRNNQRQRRPVYLHVDTDSEYPSITVTRRRLRTGELMGPFGNEWAAKTLADMLSDYYGLRRCRLTAAECMRRDCPLRENKKCQASDAYAAGHKSYATTLATALSAFNGEGARFREVLRSMQEQSARAERFEDAARYRDAIRALDRTLGALGVVRRATGEGLSVILEGDSSDVAVIVLVRGWHLTTLRFRRQEVTTAEFRHRVETALSRARRHARRERAITPRRLRDMVVIDNYRQQHSPTVLVDSDGDPLDVDRVASAVRRLMRVPRKRHATA